MFAFGASVWRTSAGKGLTGECRRHATDRKSNPMGLHFIGEGRWNRPEYLCVKQPCRTWGNHKEAPNQPTGWPQNLPGSTQQRGIPLISNGTERLRLEASGCGSMRAAWGSLPMGDPIPNGSRLVHLEYSRQHFNRHVSRETSKIETPDESLGNQPCQKK